MNNDYNSDYTIRMPREKLIAMIAIPVAAVIILALIFYNFIHIYREYDIAPGCTTSGGHYKQCRICGDVVQLSEQEPTGHKPATKVVKEPTAATNGEKETRCTVCQQLMSLEKTPAKLSPIPSLRLIGRGAGMTDKNSISATFTYTDGVEDEIVEAAKSGGNLKVRLMNSGERVDAKHSYVLTDFHVSEGDQLLFGDFGDSKEINLYANNDDPTFARRIITYRQWKDLVSELYPEYGKYIKVSDDTEYAGYNMLLYIKSTKPDYSFAGIYTLSIPYSILAEKNQSADTKYVVRQKMTKDSDTQKYSSQYEYLFGNETEKDTAISSLSTFLDAKSGYLASDEKNAILTDYFVFSLITGNIDAFSDLYWVTSDGKMWYPVPANTEHSYGCSWYTTQLSETSSFMSNFGDFWDAFFEKNYSDIKSRYRELKETRLSPSNIETEFHRAITKLDIEVYKEDAATYGAPYYNPLDEAGKLYSWYRERITVLDGFFSNK